MMNFIIYILLMIHFSSVYNYPLQIYCFNFLSLREDTNSCDIKHTVSLKSRVLLVSKLFGNDIRKNLEAEISDNTYISLLA